MATVPILQKLTSVTFFIFIRIIKQMKQGKFSENFLYTKIKQKDKESFMKAYDLYVDDIYRFISFKVKTKEEAEDISSQVFLKVWNHIRENSVKEFKTLRALLYTTARNAVIDHYRKDSLKDEVSYDAFSENFETVDKKQDIAKQAEISSDYENLLKKMSELKDEYSEVLLLKYVNELSIVEIAKIMNKSKGNIRVLIYRAVKALKKIA